MWALVTVVVVTAIVVDATRCLSGEHGAILVITVHNAQAVEVVAVTRKLGVNRLHLDSPQLVFAAHFASAAARAQPGLHHQLMAHPARDGGEMSGGHLKVVDIADAADLDHSFVNAEPREHASFGRNNAVST